jgi:hypothetical protein
MVGAGDRLDDREAEAGALRASTRLGSAEALKRLRKELGWETAPLVADT